MFIRRAISAFEQVIPVEWEEYIKQKFAYSLDIVKFHQPIDIMRTNVLYIASFISLLSFQVHAQSARWNLVFENDRDGNAVTGNHDDLIAAVRAGEEIRLGWQSPRRGTPERWVEHVADAKFITILSGQVVFAQIDGIVGQTPDFNEMKVLLKENLSWTMIAGSNGKMDAIMRDMSSGEIKGHNQRQNGFKWWVRKN